VDEGEFSWWAGGGRRRMASGSSGSSNSNGYYHNGGYTNKTATMEMVAHCFDVLYAALQNIAEPKVPPTIPNSKFPLFVTWKKGHEKKLRGCIGTFSHLALHRGLNEYALISALRDTRFDPIVVHELPELHCSVSLLINFEPARDYRDWTVGVHGIRIEFEEDRQQKNAVYLPEVAHEQGWDHTETLDNLMRKGGYRGSRITESARLSVTVIRFQSDKMVMSHKDYLTYKQRNGHSIPMLDNSGQENNGRRGLFHSCRP